jgi:WD40 repeat protein
VVTGSSDCEVNIVDIRKLSTSGAGQECIIKKLVHHKSSINVVRFSTFSKDILASAGECLIMWDLRDENDPLFFKHIGHVGSIVDFEWNPEAPWSIMSASDDID